MALGFPFRAASWHGVRAGPGKEVRGSPPGDRIPGTAIRAMGGGFEEVNAGIGSEKPHNFNPMTTSWVLFFEALGIIKCRYNMI